MGLQRFKPYNFDALGQVKFDSIACEMPWFNNLVLFGRSVQQRVTLLLFSQDPCAGRLHPLLKVGAASNCMCFPVLLVRRCASPFSSALSVVRGLGQVRAQFREIFLEMGFEEMPTDRCACAADASPPLEPAVVLERDDVSCGEQFPTPDEKTLYL
jgi:hypothetical protein